MELNWKDPPQGRTRLDWVAIMTELKAYPGRWAQIGESVGPTYAEPLKRRGATVRRKSVPNTDPPRFDVYAKWEPKDA